MLPEPSPQVRSDRRRVMVIYGTRPEAVKLAPVITALRRSPCLQPVVAVTGQHRSMLDQVHEVFGIVPDHDLDILVPGQTLEDVTVRALRGLSELLSADRPDVVLVQGDTTTSFVGALAAFYARVPVVHLEAGLRTADIWSPYPEEMNRRLTTRLAGLHLTPTRSNAANLRREGVPGRQIVVTGNTVIDALLDVAQRPVEFTDPRLAALAGRAGPVLLVTAHRRESWGEPMRRVGHALGQLAVAFPDVLIVLPAHRNPVVREALLPSLQGRPNVLLLDPLPYVEFARLLALSTVVLTDSGGVQEEAPSLGKPVLVMREETERPEGVQAGTAELVGTSPARIVERVSRLLDDPAAYAAMARAVSPYGDGRAAQRTVQAVAHFLGLGSPAKQFVPREATESRLEAVEALHSRPPHRELVLTP